MKLPRGAVERSGGQVKQRKGRYEGSMFKVIYLSDSVLNETKYIDNKNTPMKNVCYYVYV